MLESAQFLVDEETPDLAFRNTRLASLLKELLLEVGGFEIARQGEEGFGLLFTRTEHARLTLLTNLDEDSGVVLISTNDVAHFSILY